MAESSQSDEKLDLKVSDSHGALTHFKVKKTTKFRKILTAYASKAGIEERAIRLMVDGERVNLEQCPGDLDIENGDQIDAMVEQKAEELSNYRRQAERAHRMASSGVGLKGSAV